MRLEWCHSTARRAVGIPRPRARQRSWSYSCPRRVAIWPSSAATAASCDVPVCHSAMSALASATIVALMSSTCACSQLLVPLLYLQMHVKSST